MFDNYENLPLCHDLNNGELRTNDVLLENQIRFSSLLLKEDIQNGLNRCGFINLSPIQKNALPLALTGSSIIAHAKSGTGKTLVYVITALNNILKNKGQKIQCLVLAPTREIAKQIYDVFKNVGYFLKDLKIEFFIGGTAVDIDVVKCRHCHVAIGAPGRIKHLIELGELPTQDIQLLVLDEVDALLNNKEFGTMELLSYLPIPKQIIVCTATFSENVKDLLKPISPNIKYVTVDHHVNDPESFSNVLIGVRQFIAPVVTDSTSLDTIRKRNKLIDILTHFEYKQCFVFVNYITIAKSLCNLLNSSKLPALWVSSEQNQSTRIATINKLKMNQCRILVTTDLAARGIDVHNVNLVINMGVPGPPDVYIHRMGRAGRYGSEGAVITILHEGIETDYFIRVVSSVITEPVKIYLLPNELSNDLKKDQLEMISCVPRSDVALNSNEFHFRMSNIKNQTVNDSKKHTKKKKKKKSKKEKLSAHLPSPKENRRPATSSDSCSLFNNELTIKIMNNEEEIHTDLEETEMLVQGYIQSIKEEVNQKAPIINQQNLKALFEPDQKILNFSRFTNYSQIFLSASDTIENVYQATISYPHNLIEDEMNSLLEHISFIKEKNTFLDELKLPVSMQQILELIKRKEIILRDCIPSHMFVAINEILESIRRFIQPLSNNLLMECITTINNKKPLKRVNDNNHHLSDELYKHVEPYNSDNTDIESKIQKVSDWMVTNPQNHCIQHPSKRSKNQDFNLPDSTSVHFKDFNLSSNNYSRLFNNEQKSPVNTSVLKTGDLKLNVVKRNVATKYSVTCPNCKFQFNSSGDHQSSAQSSCPNDQSCTLPPLRPFVTPEIERRIWEHHFNFIGTHIQNIKYLNEHR